MNKSVYQTRSGKVLRELQSDFVENKLTQEEFEILLGFLIEREFTENIKQQIQFLMPQKRQRNRGFGFFNYERKHTHAG